MLHLKGKGNWPLNIELHVEIILCTAADFKSFLEYVMFFLCWNNLLYESTGKTNTFLLI